MAYADLVAAADRAAQTNLGGVSVTYAPAVGAPVVVQGLFDERFVVVPADANLGVEQIAPAVFLRVSDLPADPDVDDPTLTIAGRTYSVRERQRDGMGGIRLLLLRTGA